MSRIPDWDEVHGWHEFQSGSWNGSEWCLLCDCLRADHTTLLSKYERIHAYFMADPRFWYEKGRQEADKIICVLASDLREKIREGK